jgi:hypothetical protein
MLDRQIAALQELAWVQIDQVEMGREGGCIVIAQAAYDHIAMEFADCVRRAGFDKHKLALLSLFPPPSARNIKSLMQRWARRRYRQSLREIVHTI